MNREELQLYIERIGLSAVPEADAMGLAAIQQAHLATVPFENLDIAAGRLPLALDEPTLFDKIVIRRRGGICYELNLLFAAALRAIGFRVALKGGRHPKYGDDMDHLFLLVGEPGAPGSAPDDGSDDGPDSTLAGDLAGDLWLADVGFAANFAVPLRLAAGQVQDDGFDRYLLERAPEVGENYLRLWRVPGLVGERPPEEMFTFGPGVFQPADCRARCDWFCTAPESRFTQGPLVTRQEPAGRVTLSGRHLVETRDGIRTSYDLESVGGFDRCLAERFGLTR